MAGSHKGGSDHFCLMETVWKSKKNKIKKIQIKCWKDEFAEQGRDLVVPSTDSLKISHTAVFIIAEQNIGYI